MFLACLVVPSVPHAAADRKQEALHQSGGVRVRRALHLRRHHPDLPFPAANHRCFDQIKSTRGYATNLGEEGAESFRAFLKPFALFSVRIRIHLENHDALQGEKLGLNLRFCHSVGESYAQNMHFFWNQYLSISALSNLPVVKEEY